MPTGERERWSTCIACKAIPRVRPPVCCWQYANSNQNIACNTHCTPSLHATNSRLGPPPNQMVPGRILNGQTRPKQAVLTVQFHADGPSSPPGRDRVGAGGSRRGATGTCKRAGSGERGRTGAAGTAARDADGDVTAYPEPSLATLTSLNLPTNRDFPT